MVCPAVPFPFQVERIVAMASFDRRRRRPSFPFVAMAKSRQTMGQHRRQILHQEIRLLLAFPFPFASSDPAAFPFPVAFAVVVVVVRRMVADPSSAVALVCNNRFGIAFVVVPAQIVAA